MLYWAPGQNSYKHVPLFVGVSIVKSALLAQLAMCVCAPAVVATTAMTVPPVRHAVHKAVAPSPKKHAPHRRAAAPAGRPCAPEAMHEQGSGDAAALLAALDLPVESASNALREPIALADAAATEGAAAANRPLPPALDGGGATLPDLIAIAPTTPPVSTVPVMPPDPAAPVPEPSSWAMMLGGFGAVGMLIRRRRARRARMATRAAALAACAGGIADLSTGAAAVAAHTGLAGHAIKAAVLKNAGLCVCSAAAMAAAVTTVPPLRQAVFAATMPAYAPSQSAHCQADD
jgi:hypothetical protein